MIEDTRYSYDPETGTTVVDKIVDGKYVKGEAHVAPQDQKYANAYTGYAIAEARMNIDYARQHIEYDLKPQLFILNHLLGTMQKSPRFNPTSYEAKRIYAERQNILDDIDQFKHYIEATKDYIRDFIIAKDNVYRRFDQGQN